MYHEHEHEKLLTLCKPCFLGFPPCSPCLVFHRLWCLISHHVPFLKRDLARPHISKSLYFCECYGTSRRILDTVLTSDTVTFIVVNNPPKFVTNSLSLTSIVASWKSPPKIVTKSLMVVSNSNMKKSTKNCHKVSEFEFYSSIMKLSTKNCHKIIE